MQALWQKIRQLLLLKVKFAASGLVATSVDYGLYLLLVDRVLEPVPANLCAYSTAVIINFLMQRHFVFELKGSARRAFWLALAVSVVGLALNTLVVGLLSEVPWFDARQYLTKAVATGMIFFYNFYFKRYVFERRFV